MNVLAEAMDDPDRAPRLRATRYAMSFAVHLHGSIKLNADIREMCDFLDSVLSGRYVNQPEPEAE